MSSYFAHSFLRVLQLSFQNLGRNLVLSCATTAMMGLILFIFNIIMALNILSQSSLEELKSKVDLILYISDEASMVEISGLIEDLNQFDSVTKVEYTSKEDALKSFLAQYPEKTDPFTTYGIENPLPSSLKILTKSPEQHGEIVRHIQESPFNSYLLEVESADENQEIVARLLRVTRFTEKLTIGVTLTFLLGTLLMILNSTHLSIFSRKTEVQIMQLVGAKPKMIYLPFLTEGALYSFFAVLFSFFLLLAFVYGTDLNEFELFSENFPVFGFFLFELLISMVVGVASSYLAVTLYLRKSI